MTEFEGVPVVFYGSHPRMDPIPLFLSPSALMVVLRLAEAEGRGLPTREPIKGLTATIHKLRKQGIEIETVYNFDGPQPPSETGRYVMHSVAMVRELS